MERKKFADSERSCEISFTKSGPWWHLYTPGRLTKALLLEDKDYAYVMNLLARTVHECGRLWVCAFELMSNHIHIVISGTLDNIEAFWIIFRKRLQRYLSGKGIELPNQFDKSLKSIDNLKSMRNVIAYVHRNGYVVNSDVTPFSYRWGTGKYYFMDSPSGDTAGNLTRRKNEEMFRSRAIDLPPEWKIENGYVSPVSYCSVKLGMSMFRNAHQYFTYVSKSVESYSELAIDLDDGEFLTDSELYIQILKIVKEKYRLRTVKDLTKAQQCDLARTLHFDFRSSNGQIRRLLNLNQSDLEILFPSPKRPCFEDGRST